MKDPDPDRCPRCNWLQANVNNPAFLQLLRKDQIEPCMNCGWKAEVK